MSAPETAFPFIRNNGPVPLPVICYRNRSLSMDIFTPNVFALIAVLVTIALILGGTIWSGVPPMPTSPNVRRAMLALVADENPAVIYELGSGWGGLATALAVAFPHARVIGLEVSPLPWLVSRLRQTIVGPDNLSIRWGDAHKADLSDGDLVVCFLCPQVMAPLDAKLRAALRPGAAVLSNSFALHGWTPEKEIRVGDRHHSAVYLYRR